MNRMEEPPFMLDGARVLEYAIFDSTVQPTGHVSTVVDGIPVDLGTVRGVVIAQALADGGVFLLHCNERWESVVAGHFPTADAARESAQRGYAAIGPRLVKYRELTAEEAKEVETTRAFLRQLASDFPEG